jgi:hypothetical protein
MNKKDQLIIVLSDYIIIVDIFFILLLGIQEGFLMILHQSGKSPGPSPYSITNH